MVGFPKEGHIYAFKLNQLCILIIYNNSTYSSVKLF